MKFIVDGPNRLKGTIVPSGAKNAALPIICASLLSSRPCRIENVPDILDIHTLLGILEYIGSQWTFSQGVLDIHTPEIKNTEIPLNMVKHMRASILLIGPLLARTGHVRIGYPGGCVLGKRPVDTHLDAFADLGVNVHQGEEWLELTWSHSQQLQTDRVVLKEMSVTATENVLMFLAGCNAHTELRLAAQEPHVTDLCDALISMGAEIKGKGSYVLQVSGKKTLNELRHRVIADYLEIGTFAIAAAATAGDITITESRRSDLDALWQKLTEAGVILDFEGDQLRVRGVKRLEAISKIDTGIFPKFPTDLQAPFMVLMTQAHGVSKVFETLFEGRLNYLFELEKMGAQFEFLNPHQAIIIGPSRLKGVPIASCDIRAGAAMLIAALLAEGQTEISSINYIDRGYEKIDDKFRMLGARLKRVNETNHNNSQDTPEQIKNLQTSSTEKKASQSLNKIQNKASGELNLQEKETIIQL